jgi:S1-C subfamily serine protease
LNKDNNKWGFGARWRPVLAVCSLLALGVGAQASDSRAEYGKKPRRAVERSLAVYIPRNEADARLFLREFSTSFAPGAALVQAALDAGGVYFRSAKAFDETGDLPFNLALVTHAKWESKDRDSILTVEYRILDAAGETVAQGTKTGSISTQKLLLQNEFYSVSLGVMRDILGDDALLSKFADPKAHTATAIPAGFDRTLLVNRDKPAKSGTGFFINSHGQVMTAAHVVDGCPVAVVKSDDKSIDGKVVAESLLLDLAVVDAGNITPKYVVPLRIGNTYELGESVTNIGFPLNGVLTASPNVTRGNVSSRTALAGSIGQFQFSAPVQPGSSGGPVVSESGELLGVTVGTLGIENLIQRGVIPQNVNFALDARYAASFMDHNKISYESVPANRKTDLRSATDITLPAVVQILCYE